MAAPAAEGTITSQQPQSTSSSSTKTFENLLDSFSFDFQKALTRDFLSPQQPDDLSQRRISYHRTTESTQTQVCWIIERLHWFHEEMKHAQANHNMNKKLGELGRGVFKVGIVSSDVLPETGEYMAKVLIDGLLRGNEDSHGSVRFPLSPSQICVLGRRDDLQKLLPKEHQDVNVVWEWEEDAVLVKSLSVLIIICSAMHFTLVQEQLSKQDLSQTVVISLVPGITPERVSSLLNQCQMIIHPFWDFDTKPSDSKVDHRIVWTENVMSLGIQMPDLDMVRNVFRKYGMMFDADEKWMDEVRNPPIFVKILADSIWDDMAPLAASTFLKTNSLAAYHHEQSSNNSNNTPSPSTSFLTSPLPGYTDTDGTEVCIPLATSVVCDAWAASSSYLDLSYLAREANNTYPPSVSWTPVTSVSTFDEWVSVGANFQASSQGALGYIADLLRAGGCSTFGKAPASSILRYPRSFICAEAIIVHSTPISRSTVSWNATTESGGGCLQNLNHHPPSLCKDTCDSMLKSVVALLQDPDVCPGADISNLSSFVSNVEGICQSLDQSLDSSVPCTLGVSDEIVTCGFGTVNIASAVEYCNANPNENCCQSQTIISAMAQSLPTPSGSTTVDNSTTTISSSSSNTMVAVSTTTYIPPLRSSQQDAAETTSHAALIAGSVGAGVCLMTVAIIAFMVLMKQLRKRALKDALASTQTMRGVPPSMSHQQMGSMTKRGDSRFEVVEMAYPNVLPVTNGRVQRSSDGSGSHCEEDSYISTAESMDLLVRPYQSRESYASGSLRRDGRLMSSGSRRAGGTTMNINGMVGTGTGTGNGNPGNGSMQRGNVIDRSGLTMKGWNSLSSGGTVRSDGIGKVMSIRGQEQQQQQQQLQRPEPIVPMAAGMDEYASGNSSNGTLVLRRGETFGPETFRTKWRGAGLYTPKLPDELEIQVGDPVTLSTFYNDGWGYGRNERTMLEGYLPLSSVVATGVDETPVATSASASPRQGTGPRRLVTTLSRGIA
ncbi:hypothetical protein HDU76_010237 [Blyttiomyces sp. JEL0837]|nr:hypothetical protein HDU76_010237 [Blyttiomyces sp. JEL0837]